MTVIVPLVPNLALALLYGYLIVGAAVWAEDAQRGITHKEYMELNTKLNEILNHVKNL